MKRRDFIVKSSAVMASSLVSSINLKGKAIAKYPVIKVTGESPYKLAKKAIIELGGMKKFVANQDVVMVKPNIGWNRTVEQASNTNPEVIKAIIEEILNAGAKKVIIMDNTCHKAEDSYERSGIAEVAKKLGAEVKYADKNRLVAYDFKGEFIKKLPIYRDFFEVDKFINVPILKHHGSAGLTIGMKNLYGILGGRRGKLHQYMGKSIADLAKGFKVDLTIIDAYRTLIRNGPVGGRLSDVVLNKTVIASQNIFEADVVAVDVFGEIPEKYDFIKEGFKRKLGEMDLKKIDLKEFKI